MRQKNYFGIVVLVVMGIGLVIAPLGCEEKPVPPPAPSEMPAPPAATVAPAAPSMPETPATPAMKDIVDTAVGAGSFNTLVAAIKAAELVDTLKGAGPFTVFAPTDEAFANLPAGTLDDLLKPENKAKLAGILTYHVVPGEVMAADVVKLTEAKTVNGQSLTIKVEGGVVMVDGAKVTKTDIECSNGVIHVIDAVVLPK